MRCLFTNRVVLCCSFALCCLYAYRGRASWDSCAVRARPTTRGSNLCQQCVIREGFECRATDGLRESFGVDSVWFGEAFAFSYAEGGGEEEKESV